MTLSSSRDVAQRLELSRQAALARRTRSEPRPQAQPNLPTALDSLVGSSDLLGCHQEFG